MLNLKINYLNTKNGQLNGAYVMLHNELCCLPKLALLALRFSNNLKAGCRGNSSFKNRQDMTK